MTRGNLFHNHHHHKVIALVLFYSIFTHQLHSGQLSSSALLLCISYTFNLCIYCLDPLNPEIHFVIPLLRGNSMRISEFVVSRFPSSSN